MTNISSTRKLVLEPTVTKKEVDPTIDMRLLDGKNHINAKLDTATMLWSLHYEAGLVPGVFRQQFTSFSKALKCAEDYFIKKNVKVAQVID